VYINVVISAEDSLILDKGGCDDQPGVCENHPFLQHFLTSPLHPNGSDRVFPQDLGYEINEDDLASEMLAQLPDDLLGQTTPEVDPEEFESIYKWFLS